MEGMKCLFTQARGKTKPCFSCAFARFYCLKKGSLPGGSNLVYNDSLIQLISSVPELNRYL